MMIQRISKYKGLKWWILSFSFSNLFKYQNNDCGYWRNGDTRKVNWCGYQFLIGWWKVLG